MHTWTVFLLWTLTLEVLFYNFLYFQNCFYNMITSVTKKILWLCTVLFMHLTFKWFSLSTKQNSQLISYFIYCCSTIVSFTWSFLSIWKRFNYSSQRTCLSLSSEDHPCVSVVCVGSDSVQAGGLSFGARGLWEFAAVSQCDQTPAGLRFSAAGEEGDLHRKQTRV